MSETFVGIQIGAISFIDEGVEAVLDILQEKAGVNALMISALSWSIGNAGRAAFGFPDHGVAEADDLRGGAFFAPDPRYYGKTDMKQFAAPDELYAGFDALADVIPAARARGINVYTYYCETSSSAIRSIWQPGFQHLLDRDHRGRVASRPSLLNPDYKTFWHAVFADWLNNHDLRGIMWGIERQSPLMDIFRGDSSTGFDDFYVAEARARNIDVERAIAGYCAIDDLLRRARGGERPRDGVFVLLLRQLLRYPEVLLWEKLWLESHQSFYRELSGLVKFYDPGCEFGIGIWQVINTYNPYLRAQYDQADYAPYADWFKPVLYHTPAGARFADFAASWHAGALADASPDGAYDALATVLGLSDFVSPRAEGPMAGFKPAYIKEWTARLIEETGAPVYPGIGVGVGHPGESKAITPSEIREGLHAGFDGGASGIMISRNYSEAALQNLAAVGEALRERGLI